MSEDYISLGLEWDFYVVHASAEVKPGPDNAGVVNLRYVPPGISSTLTE